MPLLQTFSSGWQLRKYLGRPLFCCAERTVTASTNSFQVGGADAFEFGVMFVGFPAGNCCILVACGDAGICEGFPTIVVAIDWRSDGLSQTISFGGVTTIRPMMAAGTPSSFAIRAIDTVAAPDCTVSAPVC